MEHQQQLSMESFSFTWSRANSGSFIEMDPRVVSLMWAARPAGTHELSFCAPTSLSSPLSPQTDHDTSGGLLPPVRHFTSTAAAPQTKNPLFPASVLRSNFSVQSSKAGKKGSFLQTCDVQKKSPASVNPFPVVLCQHSIDSTKGGNTTRKKRWSSARTMMKYFCFLEPQSMSGKRLASQRRVCESLSLDNGRLDVGMEKALHEAILHCKKSFAI